MGIKVQHSCKMVKKRIKDRYNKKKIKLKTKKALGLRVKFTATGKCMHTRAGHRHNLRKRSSRFKRLAAWRVARKGTDITIRKFIPHLKYFR